MFLDPPVLAIHPRVNLWPILLRSGGPLQGGRTGVVHTFHPCRKAGQQQTAPCQERESLETVSMVNVSPDQMLPPRF